MCYFRPSKRAELGFRWHFSLATSDQLEAANYNPLFRPKSGEIRYLTGPEITHPGTGLANFIRIYGTGGTFWTAMPGMGISRWGSGVGGDVSRLEMLPLLFEGHW